NRALGIGDEEVASRTRVGYDERVTVDTQTVCDDEHPDRCHADVFFFKQKTAYEIPSFKFHLNLVGEMNVRNALGVVACAKHCGLKNHQIQAAFDTFKGIRRRMEVRGIAGGVTVFDDFGHHPTAIRETLRALRIKYPEQKVWAIFEPRTNSTRRNVFQAEL